MKQLSALATLAFLATATTVMTTSSTASAGPIGLEIGAKAGVGTNPSSGPINPLGFGIGARGGIEIIGFYAGLNIIYYTGGSQDIPGGSTSLHSLLYGIEGGYGFKLLDDILTIRPQLGIGNFNLTGKASGNVAGISLERSATDSYLYLEPGVTALIALGGFFVGADANILLVPSVNDADSTGQTSSKTYTAFTLHAQVGLKF